MPDNIKGGQNAPARPVASKRSVDFASAALLAVGIASGVVAYSLTVSDDITALILVPSVVAATIGAFNITKTTAPRTRGTR